MSTHTTVSDICHAVANTHTLVSDIRRNMPKSQEGTDDKHQSVSDTCPLFIT